MREKAHGLRRSKPAPGNPPAHPEAAAGNIRDQWRLERLSRKV
jgi:hypothetical protein